MQPPKKSRVTPHTHNKTLGGPNPAATVRTTLNVPKLTISTMTWCLAPPVPQLKPRLLGRPRSGFTFTPQERALIVEAAPSMPKRDGHGIPIVDVKLAYLVEDLIERIKEFARRENFKYVRREMGTIANPRKGRQREFTKLSSTVLHFLAGKLLWRSGHPVFTQAALSSIVEKIRAGGFSRDELQRVACEIRALGALMERHDKAASPTSNEPFRFFASHLINEWRSGMTLDLTISRDESRQEAGDPRQLTDGDAVCNDLVRLAQALHAVAVTRVQSDPQFCGLGVSDPPMIMTRSQVSFSMRRVLREMRENDKDGTGLFFCLRPRGTSDRSIFPLVEAKIRTLKLAVQQARRNAWRWLELGESSKRPKSKPRGHG